MSMRIVFAMPLNMLSQLLNEWPEHYRIHILLNTRKMERLLIVFEDCIRMIRENRPADLSNYYDNDTLPSRIKTIIRSIESLVKQNGGGDGAMLLVALSRFKDDLSIGAGGMEEMFNDPGLPGVFREAIREIFLLCESKNQQLNSMFDDVFFYKDVIQAVLADKTISEEELAMRENIAEDKRRNVAKMLQRVEELKQGQAEKGMAGLGELQEKMGALLMMVQALEWQHDEDQLKMAGIEEKNMISLDAAQAKLEKVKMELDMMRIQLSQQKEEEERLKEELNELRKEGELLQSSLAMKERDSGRLISEKESAYEQLQEKDAVIRQLKKSLNQQALDLEMAKKELALVGEAKSKDVESKLKDVQAKSKDVQAKSKDVEAKSKDVESKLEDAEAKFKDTESKLKDAHSRMKDAELRAEAMQKRLNQTEATIEERDSRIRELQDEKSKVHLESSIMAQADIELVKRASALIESAEMFSQIYQGPSQRSEMSFISESFIFNSSKDYLKSSLSASRKQEKVELEVYLRRTTNSTVLPQLMNELPKLPFAEVVYRYPEDKTLTFQERLKGKRNLLLICKTQIGAVVGAFSSSGFIDIEKEMNPSAFLFCAKDKSSKVLRAKQGRSGVVEDEDFLIFGNEQLSIEQGCDYATSYFEASSIRSLHFEGSTDDRQQFLRLTGSPSPSSRIALQRYDIVELTRSK